MHSSTLAPSSHQLLSTLHLANINENGGLKMPERTLYTLIEIGCSDWDTLDETEIDLHPYGFLISFEPVLEKYAVLLARGTARFRGKQLDMAVPLGHHHHRGVVLPLAVSPAGGVANFTVHTRAGCSSLLKANQSATATWGKLCRDVLEMRRIETISIVQAVNLSGSLPIRHLKIDAQGMDFKLIKALEHERPGLLRARVASVQLETRTSQCVPLYEGQETCDEVLAFMTALGYSSKHHCPLAKTWCERTMQFFDPFFKSYQLAKTSATHQMFRKFRQVNT